MQMVVITYKLEGLRGRTVPTINRKVTEGIPRLHAAAAEYKQQV